MTQPAAWQTTLQENAPGLLDLVNGGRESVLADGALSLKVKTLMTMLCDALLAHPEGVANIANRARAAGATEEEIAETVAVAFLFGGMPALVTGTNRLLKNPAWPAAQRERVKIGSPWTPPWTEVEPMRGRQDPQVTLLAFIDLETRVPSNHPLRVIKSLADQALKALSPDLDRMYANVGRPSIPPERLLKSSLLIALYSVRSERAFCEQLDYNLLFRWFLDMNLIEPSFDATTFTKNRERLLRHGVGQALFGEVVLEADRQGLLSDEHFTVDGTLIEAAASLKSFKPKDGDPPRTTGADPGNPSVDFHGERRGNATHQSTTDAEARLLRKGKGKEARLVFMAHALMENRHGMLVDFQTTQATGTAERDIVPELLDQARERGFHPRTLGGDKGYDTRDCVADLRRRGVTPHVAQNNKGRSSAIDGRTTRHPGYALSQRIRKRVEEIFGWMKTVGGFRRTRYRGLDRTGLAGHLVATAYNLVRMSKLLGQATATPEARMA